MARRSQAERLNELESSVEDLHGAVKHMIEAVALLDKNVRSMMKHIENLYALNPPSKGALHPDLLRQSGLQ